MGTVPVATSTCDQRALYIRRRFAPRILGRVLINIRREINPAPPARREANDDWRIIIHVTEIRFIDAVSLVGWTKQEHGNPITGGKHMSHAMPLTGWDREEVARRAYLHFLEDDRAGDHALDHWLQAEREILATHDEGSEPDEADLGYSPVNNYSDPVAAWCESVRRLDQQQYQEEAEEELVSI